MKKLYQTILISGVCLMTTNVFAQSDADIGTQMSDAEVNAILRQVDFTPHPQAQTTRGGSLCDTLATTMVGDNNFNGVMFDVDVASDVFIETFWVTLDSVDGPQNIAVFTKTGTHVGSETVPGDWTFLDSAIVTGYDNVTPVRVPISLAYAVTSGSTHAFYVTTASGGTFYYTNGVAVGNTLTSDAVLTVYEGSGGGYPFSVTFTPRNFNGIVEYCTGYVGIDEQALAEAVEVYPVPAIDQVTVTLPQGVESNLEVVSITGQTVIEMTAVVGNRAELDVSALSQGMYFVNVMTNGSRVSKKMIVE